MVTTPDGRPVAMVHCNNCTNEINAWAKLSAPVPRGLGQTVDHEPAVTTMFTSALQGDADGGGLVLLQLPVRRTHHRPGGRPAPVCPRSREPVQLRQLMRTQLYSALATLKLGMDILCEEQVAVDRLLGHGGFFKTPVVGQRMMAAAANAAVSVMETAGEGGPWGMALLAAYAGPQEPRARPWTTTWTPVFAGQKVYPVEPQAEDLTGFTAFMERYRANLAVERAAVEHYTI